MTYEFISERNSSRKNYVVFPRDGSREYQSEIFLDRSREYQRENTPYSLRDYSTVKGARNFSRNKHVEKTLRTPTWSPIIVLKEQHLGFQRGSLP